MFDENKYLYWLDKNNIEINAEVIWRELYGRIGCIFHTIQMIEYNMANIIALEEFEKNKKNVYSKKDVERIRNKIDKKFNNISSLTFGGLNTLVVNSKYLSIVDIDELHKIKTYRDFLAHRCFKDKLLDESLKTLEQVDAFIDELNDYDIRCRTMNEQLLEIFKNNKIKRIYLNE